MAPSPRPHPLLEHEDRGAALLDLGLALDGQEDLEVLDRVARLRDAQRVADDGVEVDEDVAAEEVVDLPLARAVLAHEALERGHLVGGVVVDVHGRVGAEALVEEVDELLERAPLGLAVVRPEGGEAAVRVERRRRGTRARPSDPRTGRPPCRRRGRPATAPAGARSRSPAWARAAGRPARRSRARGAGARPGRGALPRCLRRPARPRARRASRRRPRGASRTASAAGRRPARGGRRPPTPAGSA